MSLRDVMPCLDATKLLRSKQQEKGLPVQCARTRVRPDMTASSVSAWLPFVLAAGKPAAGPIGRSVVRFLPRTGRDAGWWCALRVVSQIVVTCIA